jgi:acyl-coenzyme A thioesterase 13
MTAGPEHYLPWAYPSPMLAAIGGFRQHPDDPLRMGFLVEGAKLNARGILHAGVIATIADVAIGHALGSTTTPPTRAVTVNLSCQLLGVARHGDWVDVTVDPTRLGRRLGAGSATFTTGDRLVATATALFIPS